jgi:hypothetical protein
LLGLLVDNCAAAAVLAKAIKTRIEVKRMIVMLN